MKNILLSFAALMIAAVASAQTDVTFDFTANEWGHATGTVSNATTELTKLSKDNVDIIFKYGTRSTLPYYNSNGPQVRVMQNNVIKVYAPEGKAVTKIVFTHGDYFNLSADGLSGDVWTGNSAAVKFTSTGSNFINKMVVTIADMTAETIIPTESDETVNIAIEDYGETDDSNLTADVNIVKGASGGASRAYVTLPYTTSTSALVSKNKWYYNTSTFTVGLRIFNETITIKTDPDKIIKEISMTLGNYNTANKINGATTTKTILQSGLEINSETVEMEIAGQTIIYNINVTLADKAITPYSPATGINNANAEADAAKANVVKKYVDGKQVVIEKNGKKYNVAGAQIK